MRQAINENRTVQLAMLGVLALLGGLFLMKSMGGGGDEAASTPPPSATGTTATGTTGTTGAPTATAPTATGTSTGAPAAATVTVAAPVPAEMVPGPGLPRDLLVSYGRGKAVVLLVVRGGGIDDRLVRRSVETLRSDPSLAVYVTKASEISRYAWLTQGANVTQLPALVVLSPRAVSGDTPTASVSYGFRGPPSVVQAVRDALYAGPAATYHP
ncbi:MAG: hypothetical protein AABM29_04240 [Actinomycetota bacterium]